MKYQVARIAAAAVLALGLAMPAAHAQARQVVEKIPLQHIDARIVAAALGGMVLPTEDQLFLQRVQGGGTGYGLGTSNVYGVYGGSSPASWGPNAGYGNGYGPSSNGRAPWFTRGAAPAASQPIILMDPRTNSVIAR